MKHRSFILLALLSANDRLGQPEVGRTTLVKQAFLAETIRPLYRLWLQSFGFVRYYYGPYSEELFDRLDTLIFNGLVEVTAAQRRGGKLEARYRITQAGHQLLDQFSRSDIISLATDLVWGLQSLGVEQASAICKLVYQEAEFARLFAQHNQEGTGPETKVPLPTVTAANNETFTTLAALRALQPGAGEPVPSREIVRLFLLSLALQVPRVQRTQGVIA